MPADFKNFFRRVHCAVTFKSLSSSVFYVWSVCIFITAFLEHRKSLEMVKCSESFRVQFDGSEKVLFHGHCDLFGKAAT